MPDLQADLIAHERRVWDALVAGDADADAQLLDDSFLGIYPDGFATKADHMAQLANGPSIARYALSDLRSRSLGAQHAVLSYRADFTRTGQTEGEAMYVTSIWEQWCGGWINILSQDTAVDPSFKTQPKLGKA